MYAGRHWILKIVFLMWFTAPAMAWEYPEHRNICYAAYMAACTDIGTAVLKEKDPHQLRRFRRACGYDLEHDENPKSTKQFVLPDGKARKNSKDTRQSLAAYFGDACAIAGDHIGSPEKYTSESAYANSIWFYLSLAAENADHFHPITVERFRQYWRDAMVRAKEGHENWEQEEFLFQQGLIHLAFAGHHASDAHAAGHMGFHRYSSGASAAGAYHNKYNRRGRMVRDLAGNIWRTYGDGYLCNDIQAKEDKEPKTRVEGKDFHAYILKYEERLCKSSTPRVFRMVARTVHYFTTDFLWMYVLGANNPSSMNAAMYIPNDIWRRSAWQNTTNWRPVRPAWVSDGLVRKTFPNHTGVISATGSFTGHLGIPIDVIRFRLLAGGLIPVEEHGLWGAELSPGIIWTLDIPKGVFTPEMFFDWRMMGLWEDPSWLPDEFLQGPVLGGRVMIEAYHFNIAIEGGWQYLLDGEHAFLLSVGLGKVWDLDGSNPVRPMHVNSMNEE